MTTEHLNSGNEELKPKSPENAELNVSAESESAESTQEDPVVDHQNEISEQKSEHTLAEDATVEQPEVNPAAEVVSEALTEEISTEEVPLSLTNTPINATDSITDKEIVEEQLSVVDDLESHQDHQEEEEIHIALASLTLPQILDHLEKIINQENAGSQYKKFNQLKQEAFRHIQEETDEKKLQHTQSGEPEENFSFEHPSMSKLSGLISIYKEKQDLYHQQQEAEQAANLNHRQSIIERLKNLYTNSEPGTNFFKEIREIKQDWSSAGQVAKSEFKLLNNNYFHHLNQFYQMLDLNKEYLEQEYAHNLEKREHIIARAIELENEESVQKALNELQFLHKLWKEEAEPVAEEFRESTWEKFKEISNKIHERKSELTAQIDAEQQANLERKNNIIEEIKKLSVVENNNHNHWQNAIKNVENLRSEFLKIGSVPRKISNQNWNDFKQTLRQFNVNKNDFYKSLKNSQQHNLDEKLKLIEIAKDNMNSEDWETMVPLYKKLQDDWKKIGHVPRSMTNKVWDDFREACNTFFNNYRTKNAASGDNWKENYKLKRTLLDELKAMTEEDGSVEKIEEIKTSWNNIGKVPRDKIAINSEFNKALREKMKLYKIHDYELKEEGLSENQLTDKARKIKNQIADLEAEIVKLENNLGFFSNPNRDNPLLKDTFDRIDEKKEQLEVMKQSLHHIISGE